MAAPLRFLTAGSVDDGKSTLIGRMLLDSRAVLRDQLDQLLQRGHGTADLSLLTDGLEAEREQGITIDVAYRYFATPQRKFIIADAPGHEQYTRNMVTAASGSDAAVVLVDITKLHLGVCPLQLLPQTRRHALLAQLLRVPSIVFAVNKLDAVADPAAAFAAVHDALHTFAAGAGIRPAGILPVSALRGDNVVTGVGAGGSPWAAWYQGPSLLELLIGLPDTAGHDRLTADDQADKAEMADVPPLRLAVQYVERRGNGANPRRVLWGRVSHGRVRAGDPVQVLPSGEVATVRSVLTSQGPADVHVEAGWSTGLVLDRPLDVSRGDWIVQPQTLVPTTRCHATLAWLDTDAAQVGRRYLVRHGHRWAQARIARIVHRLDIARLRTEPADALAVNDIGEVALEFQQPLPLLPFGRARDAGALIIVDPSTHRTSGAAMVLEH